MGSTTSAPAPDRRPIRARSHPVWVRAAGALTRAGFSANAISIVGMVAGLAAGAALATTPLATAPWPRVLWACAAVLIVKRLLCNMLDGMVAINSGRASPLGQIFNEVPDRVSDAAALVGLGYATGSNPTLGWAAASAAIFVAYIRAAAKVAGAPQDYRGPMAKQQRMFIVILVALFAAIAPADWQPTVSRDGWSIPIAALWLITIGCILTAIRRLGRASSILRQNHA